MQEQPSSDKMYNLYSEGNSQGSSNSDEDIPNQGNNQDVGSYEIKHWSSVNALEDALGVLGENCDTEDVLIPSTGTEWQNMYEETLEKSKTHCLTYKQHLFRWIKLLTTACAFEKSEQVILNCYYNAISMLPIQILETSNLWVALLDGLYFQLYDGKISEEAATDILKTALNKFKSSPKHARTYWNVIFKNEKYLMKKAGKTITEQKKSIIDLYKIRFAHPYLGVDEDYNEFSRWCVDAQLPKEQKLEVQHIYLKNCNKMRLELFSNILEKSKLSSHELNHHLLFEEWINLVCNEELPAYEDMENICEELICTDPKSLCFYWTALHVLASPKFEEIEGRKAKLYDIVQRGFRFGETACEGLEQRFLEQSLVIVSKILSPEKVVELIDAAIAKFPLTEDPIKWYGMSRGVMITVSNMVYKAKLAPESLHCFFYKLIRPCTIEIFKNNVVPKELEDKSGFETQLVELVRLWVNCQESYFGQQWSTVLQMWTNIFTNNGNPIMLMGYVDFVKCRGSPSETLEATSFALGQFAQIEYSQERSRTIRRCYIKLLHDHLQVLSLTNDTDRQIEIARELQRRLTTYISQYGNEFPDLLNQGNTINGFSPSESMWNTQSGSEKLSQKSDATCKSAVSECSIIANKMESLNVGQDMDVSDLKKKRENPWLCNKVFVSNLNYYATQRDIKNAFQHHGFHPVEIVLKMNQNRFSRGIAHVTFKTKEEADYAIQTCNRFIVCGRITYVSEFKTGQRSPTQKLQPTLVIITYLTHEWGDLEKLFNRLSPFGHIRRIGKEGTMDSFTLRIEYYTPEDASNACDQILKKKIFGDGITCRIGYASKKRQRQDKTGKEAKPKKRKTKELYEHNAMESGEISIEMSPPRTNESLQVLIDPHAPKKTSNVASVFAKKEEKQKQTSGLNLVPTQALRQNQPRALKRTHMKTKLNYGGPSVKSSTKTSKEKKTEDQNSSQESELDYSLSSQSSSTSSGESPKKRTVRMTTDQDIKKLLGIARPNFDFPNGEGSFSHELEFATNSTIEEEMGSEVATNSNTEEEIALEFATNSNTEQEMASSNESHSLTNKDFQKLFEKK